MTSSASTTNPERTDSDDETLWEAREAYSEMDLSIADLVAWSEVLNHIAFTPHRIEGGVVRVIADAINKACHGLNAERENLGRLALGITIQDQIAAHRRNRAMPREFAR